MRFLVTGATSGLGRNAAEWLIQQGHEVRACGRDVLAGQQLAAMGILFTSIDLTLASVATCRALMAGCDAVWHCAAKSSPWGPAQDFYQTNVQVSERLAEAAGQCGIPQFIHISTPAIYFDYQHHIDIDEDYLARRFACHYAHSKFLAEQRILQIKQQYPQTRYLILRPRGLFGPYDRVVLPRILRQISHRGGVLPLPRGGNTLLDLTFVGNVVAAMFLATQCQGPASGAIYNITNHQPERLAVMLQALLADQMEMTYQIKSAPYRLLQTVATGMEWVSALTRQEPPFTRYSIGTVSFDMTLSPQRAINELGYRPRFSLQEGIALTGEWFNRQTGRRYG